MNKVNIDNVIKGYITGFFDAEGTIRITMDYCMEVYITQTYIPVLERINSMFKEGKIHVQNKENYKDGIHRKNAWILLLSSNKAIPFLDYINQYSIEKRKQAELAIKYQKDIKVLCYDDRRGLSEIEIQKREWFRTELKRLKHEKYGERETKNHEIEIRKLSIPRDIREGKQSTLFGETIEEIYRKHGIPEKDEIENNKYYIPDMSEDVFIGYLSGFFDGEGCVRIHKTVNPLGYRLGCDVGNTNFDILKMYGDKFGGNINKEELEKEHYKQKWRWFLWSNSSLVFLKVIELYSIVKKEQIKIAIEFQEWHNQIGRIQTYEQKQKAEWYYIKLRELKKETGENAHLNVVEFEPKTSNKHPDYGDIHDV